MNGLERVLATAAFAPADRVPVIGQVFGHAATSAGVPLQEYLCDGALLAQCQLAALERYGYDAVFALLDTGVETEALGSTLTYPAGGYPVVLAPRFARGMDPATLSLPNPLRDGRMPELLKAARIMRRTVGDDVLVVGCVLGPMTLATQLMGIEQALYAAIDEPQRLAELLDFTAQVAIEFGRAQLDAGVHLTMVFEPSASPAVVPWQFFRELVLPRVQRVLAALKAAGAVANWLHITGPTDAILPFYVEAGADIANFDYLVSPEAAAAALPDRCLNGNITPLAFVDADPDEITASATALLAFFRARGGYILSPGCEIPLQAKPENIIALVKAARP